MNNRRTAKAPAHSTSVGRAPQGVTQLSRVTRGLAGVYRSRRTAVEVADDTSEHAADRSGESVTSQPAVGDTHENEVLSTTSAEVVEFPADESEPSSTDDADASDLEDATPLPDGGEPGDASPQNSKKRSTLRTAALAGILIVTALSGLAGWLGWRAETDQRDAAARALFLEVGRQGALNLTTIDFRTADSDVQRIVDTSTGNFEDDFQSRSKAFIETVKQAQSITAGSITEAGIESINPSQAQVLVGVSVKAQNAADPNARDRSWRMRITVQKVGTGAKVSNVEFVV